MSTIIIYRVSNDLVWKMKPSMFKKQKCHFDQWTQGDMEALYGIPFVYFECDFVQLRQMQFVHGTFDTSFSMLLYYCLVM